MITLVGRSLHAGPCPRQAAQAFAHYHAAIVQPRPLDVLDESVPPARVELDQVGSAFGCIERDLGGAGLASAALSVFEQQRANASPLPRRLDRELVHLRDVRPPVPRWP